MITCLRLSEKNITPTALKDIMKSGKINRGKPYVFTEQGVYRLMTVSRGELAIKQSRALVKTFKNQITH